MHIVMKERFVLAGGLLYVHMEIQAKKLTIEGGVH